MTKPSRFAFDPVHRSRLARAAAAALCLILLTAGGRASASVALTSRSVFYPAGSGAVAVGVADLNADGKPDVVTANYSANSVSVMLGNGDGSLGVPIEFPTGAGPLHVTIADMNGDGRPDLVTTNNDQTTSILRGFGDGTFDRADLPLQWTVDDVNGNGSPDLIAARNGKIETRINAGDGTFAPVNAYAVGSSGTSWAAGELTGDGKSDVVLSTATGFRVLRGNGDGSFTARDTFQSVDPGAGEYVAGLRLIDVSGDGRLDVSVAWAGQCGQNGCAGGYANYENTGLTFTPMGRTSDDPVAVADLDGDGYTEVLSRASDGSLRTYWYGQWIVAGWHVLDLAVGDLNLDGHADLAATGLGDAVCIYLGNGNGTFGTATSYALDFSPAVVVSGDLNNDGNIDLVSTHETNPATHDPLVSVLLGTDTDSYSLAGTFDVGILPVGLALGDLNDDGRLDLAVANASATVAVLLGDGMGGFGPRIPLASAAGPRAVTIGDMDGDGRADIVALGPWGIEWLPGNGNGTFGTPRYYEPSDGFANVVAIDLNEDGREDLVLTKPVTGVVSVVLGVAGGGFGPRTDFGTGSSPQYLATADLNGDGHADVVATGDGGVAALLGNGSGGLFVRSQIALGGIQNRPATGDLDADGAVDLAVVTGQSAIAILRGVGDGTFGPAKSYGTSGWRPWWVRIADRNGDQLPDVTAVSSGRMGSDGPRVFYAGGATVDVLINGGMAPGDSVPSTPIPRFLTPTGGQPPTIFLGDTFDITFRVRNDGRGSDDGRITVSFPTLTSPADAARVSSEATGDVPGYVETPAGGKLYSASCDSITASYLVAEYVDADWKPFAIETNPVTFTVRPSTTGTFEFYVRSTMHNAGGAACDIASGLPAGGEAGHTDQQGWAVRRFAVTVLPTLTQTLPMFTLPVDIQGSTISLGQNVRVSVVVRNDGGYSDDGRIVVGFPTLTAPADSQLVSSVSGGDSPGYREVTAGAASSDSLCRPITAPYLSAQYVDNDWKRLAGETDSLVLFVRPREVGTFYIDVRSTMRIFGFGSCDYTNAIPGGGAGSIVSTDAEGWTVRRFAITVAPGLPVPAVTMSGPPSSVTVGHAFAFSVAVSDSGGGTDNGRISASFPNLRAASDTQWVSVSATGGTGNGVRKYPPGSVLLSAACGSATTAYLSVEYQDSAWAGSNTETHQLQCSVIPQVTGAFTIKVRSTMHPISAPPCSYVNGVPVNGSADTDQLGYPVRAFTVQVVDAAQPPVFTSPVAGIPSSILLGESFTFAVNARNNGVQSNDGRITFGFPTLTQTSDFSSVVASVKRPSGSVLPDSACAPITSSYLIAEYVDANWTTGKTNTLLATVQPTRAGTFYVDVRTTLRDVGGGPCLYLNGIPNDGAATATDQQGWTVRRYAVNVVALPSASVTWQQIVPYNYGPSGRAWPTGVYDPKRHAFIVYGGYNQIYRNDVWTLSLDDGAWTQITPGGPLPSRRLQHSMIMNPLDDQVVIFGGEYAGFLSDLVVMTLTTPWWFPNPGHGSPPSARSGHMAVLDPVRNRMLVIGGYDGQLKNDVWEYAPPGVGTWRQLTPLGSPMPPRSKSAAVYDPVRDRVVIVGGNGILPMSDVWALNLSGGDPTWEELHPTGGPPSPRSQHTAVYDSVTDRILVFGGFDGARRGDLWALNLRGTPSWSLLTSRTPPPSPRNGQVAIYDAVRSRMVMFGGQIGPSEYSDEVWVLDADAVTPVAVSLASTEAHSDLVHITWAAEGASSLSARVHRTVAGSDEWIDLGKPTIAGTDRLTFDDHAVTPGTRYGYRLAVMDGGQETLFEPAWVTVPMPAVLALAGAAPNPSDGLVSIQFSLPGKEPATLELFDLRGRRVAYREVGSMGPGEHTVPLSEQPNLPAGVYLVRLTREGRVLTAKACVVK